MITPISYLSRVDPPYEVQAVKLIGYPDIAKVEAEANRVAAWCGGDLTVTEIEKHWANGGRGYHASIKLHNNTRLAHFNADYIVKDGTGTLVEYRVMSYSEFESQYYWIGDQAPRHSNGDYTHPVDVDIPQSRFLQVGDKIINTVRSHPYSYKVANLPFGGGIYLRSNFDKAEYLVQPDVIARDYMHKDGCYITIESRDAPEPEPLVLMTQTANSTQQKQAALTDHGVTPIQEESEVVPTRKKSEASISRIRMEDIIAETNYAPIKKKGPKYKRSLPAKLRNPDGPELEKQKRLEARGIFYVYELYKEDSTNLLFGIFSTRKAAEVQIEKIHAIKTKDRYKNYVVRSVTDAASSDGDIEEWFSGLMSYEDWLIQQPGTIMKIRKRTVVNRD